MHQMDSQGFYSMLANGSIYWTHEMENPSLLSATRTRSDRPFSVAPAVHNTLILLSGYEGDAFALDLETGRERWRFHTRPRAGEYGHETWSQVEAGANDWSEIARTGQFSGYFLPDNRIAQTQLHWKQPSGRQSFQQLCHCTGRDKRKTPVAFSGNQPRHLGFGFAGPTRFSFGPSRQRVGGCSGHGEQDGEHTSVDRTGVSNLLAHRRKRLLSPDYMMKKPLPTSLRAPQPLLVRYLGWIKSRAFPLRLASCILNRLHPSEAGASANMGWFEPLKQGNTIFWHPWRCRMERGGF